MSNLFCGSISDSEITKQSGLLELIESGDAIMADKGFTIRDLLSAKGAYLNIPPFNWNGRFTSEEVMCTHEIASLRIHVERAIRRVKEYQLFSSPIQLSTTGTVNQLWAVACLLTNFYGPLF